jgi:hypothetical protein
LIQRAEPHLVVRALLLAAALLALTVQVCIWKANFETSKSHFRFQQGAFNRVFSGAMGLNYIQLVHSPTSLLLESSLSRRTFFFVKSGGCDRDRFVALRVAFERQTLKPVFSLDRL